MPAIAVAAELWRGGTSRGVVLDSENATRVEERNGFASLLGSPDPLRRQVDGVGGGTSSTSKLVVLEPSSDPRHDVDFTFFQIPVDGTTAERRGSCGNMLAVAGAYAIDRGWLPAREGRTTVRVRCVNTGASVTTTVAVQSGRYEPTGPYTFDGVRGSGSEVRLQWQFDVTERPQIPLGTTTIDLDGTPGRVVDLVNPLVVVEASAIGVRSPTDFVLDPPTAARLERARVRAAELLGLGDAPSVPAAVPKVAICWPTRRGCAVRAISMGAIHATVPLTVAMALACDLLSTRRVPDGAVTIDHPAGAVTLLVTGSPRAGSPVAALSITRTARRIFAGQMFIPA